MRVMAERSIDRIAYANSRVFLSERKLINAPDVNSANLLCVCVCVFFFMERRVMSSPAHHAMMERFSPAPTLHLISMSVHLRSYSFEGVSFTDKQL